MRDLESRVTELEMSLAHQQRLCEQLNDVVTSQTRQLIALEKLVPSLQQQLKELKFALKGDQPSPHDERPPHY